MVVDSERCASRRILQISIRSGREPSPGRSHGAVVARLSVNGAVFWVSGESPENVNSSAELVGGGTVRMFWLSPIPMPFSRALSRRAPQRFFPLARNTAGDSDAWWILSAFTGKSAASLPSRRPTPAIVLLLSRHLKFRTDKSLDPLRSR